MTDVTITPLPAAPLHVFEIWGHGPVVATRFEQVIGFTLPAMGQSRSSDATTLMRFEPTVWLVEGDAEALPAILGNDGALTAIGGGIVRVALHGPGWRRLLMEGGVFDAESPSFAPGCCAATIIDHVAVRLHVKYEDVCIAYVPASYAADMVQFWQSARDAG